MCTKDNAGSARTLASRTTGWRSSSTSVSRARARRTWSMSAVSRSTPRGVVQRRRLRRDVEVAVFVLVLRVDGQAEVEQTGDAGGVVVAGELAEQHAGLAANLFEHFRARHRIKASASTRGDDAIDSI